ncbi:AAA family ATPase [Lentisalinibacter sediminis]|uniref:AAA family ATPase n=1 Tax=Lentisalinibacter sediminis TaxID=2992237 RepID=UPI00386510F2
MRLKAVSLRWFRGAADVVDLPASNGSLVVYGQNGSGKSSFVDGLEFAINAGKIGHLRHEYSGRNQENAVLNTHKPHDETSEVRLTFQDNSVLEIEINRDGTHRRTGTEAVDIGAWEYRRVVLRQDEVAEFIRIRKGDKYSALLPLFGLHNLDVAAENLHQLSKRISAQSELSEKKALLRRSESERAIAFAGKTDADIGSLVEVLHKKYCPDSYVEEPIAQCQEVRAAIDGQVAALSDRNNLFAALQEIGAIDMPSLVAEFLRASAELAKSMEPLVAEKIAILRASQTYSAKLEPDAEVECPACGRDILAAEFIDHVRNEHERLDELTAAYAERETSIASIVDAIKLLKNTITKPKVVTWRDEQKTADLKANIDWLEAINAEDYRRPLGEDDLEVIQKNCGPIIAKAQADSAEAPPEISDINADRDTVGSAKMVLTSVQLKGDVAWTEALINLIETTQQEVRKEIRDRSQEVIDEISSDIMEMWKCLHPSTAVEDVHLCMPDGDKAIDIGLKFHGKEQDSPRLTLSEGNRNCLGLCIFLAMAKREEGTDKPLVLDDVVISLDREHRGMVAQLLEKHFADRQVVLLTHDRVWYAELTHVLDNARWQFRMLLPYRDPTTGIRWSQSTSSFDDARELIASRPDTAANDARKIMDAESALIAERLRIRLPYLRGIRNDSRTCGDFIGRLASAAKKCLQRKVGADHVIDEAGAKVLQEAAALLVTWANRGSHSHDVVPAEAEQLLDKCEQVLAVFHCDDCGKKIYATHAESRKLYQCDCGGLRWRYGKEGL